MTDPEGTCAYVARKDDPSNWHGDDPDDWVLEYEAPYGLEQEVWECPHEALDGEEYCTFHTDPEDVPDNVDEGERFTEAVNEGSAVDEQGVEAVESRPSTMVFEDLETFGRVFRVTNLELLEAIAEHEPTSTRELARIVDRNPPEVLDNVKQLWQYGLVELEEKGRAKRPSIWYDEIEADLPLRQSTP